MTREEHKIALLLRIKRCQPCYFHPTNPTTAGIRLGQEKRRSKRNADRLAQEKRRQACTRKTLIQAMYKLATVRQDACANDQRWGEVAAGARVKQNAHLVSNLARDPLISNQKKSLDLETLVQFYFSIYATKGEVSEQLSTTASAHPMSRIKHSCRRHL